MLIPTSIRIEWELCVGRRRSLWSVRSSCGSDALLTLKTTRHCYFHPKMLLSNEFQTHAWLGGAVFVADSWVFLHLFWVLAALLKYDAKYSSNMTALVFFGTIEDDGTSKFKYSGLAGSCGGEWVNFGE